LRQRGVIRFARKEGNHKWFRLTPDSLKRQSELLRQTDAEV
jgi:hypothetical protein